MIIPVHIERVKKYKKISPVRPFGVVEAIKLSKVCPGPNCKFDPAVQQIQLWLQQAGFALPMYGADGKFGSETEAAVKAFQRAQKLPITGVVDAITFTKLETVAMAVPTPGVPPTPSVPPKFMPIPSPTPISPITPISPKPTLAETLSKWSPYLIIGGSVLVIAMLLRKEPEEVRK